MQIPCRNRKVRCDLGPVDNPHEPPCVRCRREGKECFFSATRRKRKAEGGDEELGKGEEEAAAQLARRKCLRTDGSFDDENAGSRESRPTIDSASTPPQSLQDGYDQPQGVPYRQPGHYATGLQDTHLDIAQDQEVTNEAAAALFQSPINTPGDALHLLLKASGESEDLTVHESSGSTKVRQQDVPGHRSSGRVPLSRGPYGALQRAGQPANIANIDPAIAGTSHEKTFPSREALNIWARLRFVRAGWFTAKEAIAYID